MKEEEPEETEEEDDKAAAKSGASGGKSIRRTVQVKVISNLPRSDFKIIQISKLAGS